MQDATKHLLFVGIAIAILVLDQWTKWLIMKNLAIHSGFPVIPGFIDIVHVRNPGGAFGIFADGGATLRIVLFVFVAIIAAGLIFYLHYRTPSEYRLLTAGFALIFSGAIGNLIDRIRFGTVIDFIDVHAAGWHWPAFNVADSAITVGMIIFAWYLLIKKVPA